MQIYNKKGKLIKRCPEYKDVDFANSFETNFDKEPESPEEYAEMLEIGFEMTGE